METENAISCSEMLIEMQERLKKQYMTDSWEAKSRKRAGELEEELDIIKSDYDFNLSKLDDIDSLISRDEQLQRKLLQSKIYIEENTNSERGKIQAILTSASVLNRVNTRTQDLSNEEFYLLIAAMVPIPLNDYALYGDILSHPLLLKTILEKNDDIAERLEICNKIFDHCEVTSYEDMPEMEYLGVIRDSLNIVNRHQVKEKKNIK